MKYAQFVCICAILILFTCLAVPVMAANDTPIDEATLYYNAGVKLLSQNNYAEAISLFDQALASNTTMIRMSDALLYTYQGKSYALIQLGRYQDALQTIQAGLAIYPDDPMLMNNKGYALYKAGNYAGAVAAYDIVLASDSTKTGTWVNKGDALYQMGDYTGASAAYATALANNNGSQVIAAKLADAQKASATSRNAVMAFAAVVVIAIAGGAVVYFMKRTPEEPKTGQKTMKKTRHKMR